MLLAIKINFFTFIKLKISKLEQHYKDKKFYHFLTN